MPNEMIYLRLNIGPEDPLYNHYRALQDHLGLKNHAEVVRYLIRSKRIPSHRPEVTEEMRKEAQELREELSRFHYEHVKEAGPLMTLLDEIANGGPDK